MQPIILYSHALGPNPWKVAIILEELNLAYETRFVSFTEVKQEPFTSKLNPNGRLPAIEDPNTGLTLFESGAIVEYLIDQYDADHKLDYADAARKYEAKAWLHLQVSGQGPYYGQAGWFRRLAPEHIPLAVQRYGDEVRRVTSVLDKVLSTRDWLVGDKCTYADLSFMPWQRRARTLATDPDTFDEDFPHAAAWFKRLSERESVKKAFAAQDAAIEELERAGAPL
ncbi:glutathione S-transferase family protein [Aspergillus homomorphus CBS 101889]|uniref:glutathione transferase n=1 Tax=Aspergillus homomorphus (strain CBS 101889) TaxID=1450537 RepID=A0A395I5A8_ASPHC|nr:glutathione-s-transferase theta, gst [Aspergillus homomorphus CBS 101889]RAL14378.1 glutathione-s-transferase theta, gst [Aspergillus homomorphus CBS 101889]